MIDRFSFFESHFPCDNLYLKRLYTHIIDISNIINFRTTLQVVIPVHSNVQKALFSITNIKLYKEYINREIQKILFFLYIQKIIIIRNMISIIFNA